MHQLACPKKAASRAAFTAHITSCQPPPIARPQCGPLRGAFCKHIVLHVLISAQSEALMCHSITTLGTCTLLFCGFAHIFPTLTAYYLETRWKTFTSYIHRPGRIRLRSRPPCIQQHPPFSRIRRLWAQDAVMPASASHSIPWLPQRDTNFGEPSLHEISVWRHAGDHSYR